MAQEYPDDPEEAFIRSGRPVFDLEAIRLIEPIEPDRGYLKSSTGRNNYDFYEDGGAFAIWDYPCTTAKPMLLELTLQKVWVMVTLVLPMSFLLIPVWLWHTGMVMLTQTFLVKRFLTRLGITTTLLCWC
jgi:hypothetical protein